jgi:hypothetical protein
MNQDQKDAATLEHNIFSLIKNFENSHPHLMVTDVVLDRLSRNSISSNLQILDDVELTIVLK